MINSTTSLKRVVVVIEEAAQKRVRELSVEEPYAKSEEVYVTRCSLDVDRRSDHVARHQR